MPRSYLAAAAVGLFTGSAGSPSKVQVTLLSEAGCAPCQHLIQHELADLIAAEGVADIVDFDHQPWGNAYYATEACGKGPYNSSERACWFARCMDDATPPADCFNGTVVGQHGEEEAKVDRMEACAKATTENWQAYWPFLLCMEQRYEHEGLNATDTCQVQAHTGDYDMNRCYYGADGDAAVEKAAMETFDHPGTPWLTVNGKHVEDVSKLLKIVCDAYIGPKPIGCFRLDVTIVSGAGDHALLTGPVQRMVVAEGMAEIISLEHFPWGNNYYSTSTCGGEPYSDGRRACWYQHCVNTTTHFPDCFSAGFSKANIVTENTTAKEVDVLLLLACAKLAAADWRDYWTFVQCMESAYDTEGADAGQACAESAGLRFNELQQCLDPPLAMVGEAAKTPAHVQLPYILINGVPVANADLLLEEVCAAYMGELPPGCALQVV